MAVLTGMEKKIHVSTEQIRAARQADLYEFLRNRHAADVKIEGNSLRLKDNNSISVRRGYAGYKDFSTGETGNGIDLLTNYLGYTMPEAVLALGGSAVATGTTGQTTTPPPRAKDVEFPARAGDYRQLFAYLQTQRKIPAEVIQRLIDQSLLYQAKETNNAVFINRKRDFAELRGTLSQKPFHGVLKTQPDRFWSFEGTPIGQGEVPTAYICESAIDAISLYLLHTSHGEDTRAHYCSLAGVANQQTIDRIKRHSHAILAVDKDAAGDRCREQNRDIPHILPKTKDWNEDWYKEQASDKILYVLRLEDGCYYIGQSEQHCFEDRVSKHFRGQGSEWTKLHAPIEIVEQSTNYGNYRDFELRENEKTIEYMRRYGVSKVRGGFFTMIDEEQTIKNLRSHGYDF